MSNHYASLSNAFLWVFGLLWTIYYIPLSQNCSNASSSNVHRNTFCSCSQAFLVDIRWSFFFFILSIIIEALNGRECDIIIITQMWKYFDRHLIFMISRRIFYISMNSFHEFLIFNSINSLWILKSFLFSNKEVICQK